MITKKKEAVELLTQYKALFGHIIGKSCTIQFDMHNSNGFIVSDIVQKTIGDVANKPEKMKDDTGKIRTPMLFEVVNNQSPLYFTFDDTIVTPLSNGIRLSVALDHPINNRKVVEVDIRLE